MLAVNTGGEGYEPYHPGKDTAYRATGQGKVAELGGEKVEVGKEGWDNRKWREGDNGGEVDLEDNKFGVEVEVTVEEEDGGGNGNGNGRDDDAGDGNVHLHSGEEEVER